MNVTKTAVSLPREIFDEGEHVARDLGISRSELYARALQGLFRERKIAAAREQLDRAIADDESPGGMLPADLHSAASAAIKRATKRGESTW